MNAITQNRSKTTAIPPAVNKVTVEQLAQQVGQIRQELAAETKISDSLKIQMDEVWKAITQLQEFVQEDANTIEALLNKQAQLESMYSNMVSSLEEIRVAVTKVADQAGEPKQLTEEEEKLYSFLGIEAPASKWRKIAMSVVSVVAACAAMYYGYKYLNQPKNIGVGVVEV